MLRHCRFYLDNSFSNPYVQCRCTITQEGLDATVQSMQKTAPAHGNGLAELICKADFAMYEAKKTEETPHHLSEGQTANVLLYNLAFTH